MKIYIIPIEENFRPASQIFMYPAHNKDYGVEQDFFEFMDKNKVLITTDPNEADWHYLPIFWTRWHLNHNYGKNGLKELQEEVDKKIIDSSKTFTICQYDDGPLIKTEEMVIFLGSRKTESGIDIPVLCSIHRMPFFTPYKKFLASFAGKLKNHEIRKKMAEILKNRSDVQIIDGLKSTRFFVRQILKSYISLCPRGYGGSSFRFFESMQLGVVPFHIGDIDIRPFKKFIRWDKISFYTNKVEQVESILGSRTREDLLKIGTDAKKFFFKNLAFGKWCKYVILELDSIKKLKTRNEK